MFDRTELVLKSINEIINKYKIPELQRLVDKNHISAMIKDQKSEYSKYGKFSILQSFTIAYNYVEDIGYILDGQHRLLAFAELKLQGYNIDNVLVPIVKYNINKNEDIEEYFSKINKHSPIKPIGNLISDEKKLCQLLLDKFNIYFKHKEKECRCNSPYISFNQMIENINVRNINKKLVNVNKNIMDLWDNILGVDTFLSSISEKQLNIEVSKKFLDCKKKGLKENKEVCYLGVFRKFEWLDLALYALINDKDINKIGVTFYNDIMKSKKRVDIPWCIRVNVWKKFTTNMTDEGKCYVCNNNLQFNNMECGHIIAHALGGEANYDNLMPICKTCNRDMGTMNMHEYKLIIPEN